jgi:SAM-dependent methyltransferase
MVKRPSSKPRPSRKRKPKPLTRGVLDKRRLYELAVQSPDSEIDFVTARFRAVTGRPLRLLREDFCASAASACEFVKRHKDNRAVGLDIDAGILAWGLKHNVARLPPEARSRIRLLRRNVMTPGSEGRHADCVLAMNFSYWVFDTRDTLRAYFKTVRDSLKKDGVFFLDSHGGWESDKLLTERRRVYAKGSHFTYVWDQSRFDPLTHRITCHIHFEFPRGKPIRRAFTYRWRLWSLPELQELLTEVGFRDVTVYWEGDDDNGGGNGVFRPIRKPQQCASYICYISARR